MFYEVFTVAHGANMSSQIFKIRMEFVSVAVLLLGEYLKEKNPNTRRHRLHYSEAVFRISNWRVLYCPIELGPFSARFLRSCRGWCELMRVIIDCCSQQMKINSLCIMTSIACSSPLCFQGRRSPLAASPPHHPTTHNLNSHSPLYICARHLRIAYDSLLLKAFHADLREFP